MMMGTDFLKKQAGFLSARLGGRGGGSLGYQRDSPFYGLPPILKQGRHFSLPSIVGVGYYQVAYTDSLEADYSASVEVNLYHWPTSTRQKEAWPPS
jgi:hypothetical protein